MYQHCIVKEVVQYRGLRSEKGIFSDPADISNNAEEMVLKEANLVENILQEFFFLSFSNVNFAFIGCTRQRRRNCCKYVSFTLTFFCFALECSYDSGICAKSSILYHTFYLNILNAKNLQQQEEGRRHFAHYCSNFYQTYVVLIVAILCSFTRTLQQKQVISNT